MKFGKIKHPLPPSITTTLNTTMELNNEEKAKIFALYLGCKINSSLNGTVLNATWLQRIESGECDAQLLLKPLSAISEEDIFNLLNLIFPDDIEEKPDIDDYDFDMFYNDDATMVDGDVAVGANVSCICYEGQIAITYDGTIHMFDEAGEREKMYNLPKAYQYLLSNGFDLFGLIDAGIALDATTINTTI